MRGRGTIKEIPPSSVEESRKLPIISLDVKDDTHPILQRLRQEEIIEQQDEIMSKLQELQHTCDTLSVALDQNSAMIDQQSKIMELGLRLLYLVPVCLTGLLVISYFFYTDKISEYFFAVGLIVLALPFIGEWLERGMRLLPIVGDLFKKTTSGGPK